MIRTPLTLLLLVHLAACRTETTEAPDQPESSLGPVIATGIASFYHDSLEGRPTASGEPYDPSLATCAHRKLPLGTELHITRLANGKTARCRVNDRGPFVDDRVIDLSRAVAQQLDIDGIAKVELRRVAAKDDAEK